MSLNPYPCRLQRFDLGPAKHLEQRCGSRLAGPTIHPADEASGQEQMRRCRMAAQDRQGLGKEVPNAVIKSERHRRTRFRSQQSVEIDYCNFATLERIK